MLKIVLVAALAVVAVNAKYRNCDKCKNLVKTARADGCSLETACDTVSAGNSFKAKGCKGLLATWEKNAKDYDKYLSAIKSGSSNKIMKDITTTDSDTGKKTTQPTEDFFCVGIKKCKAPEVKVEKTAAEIAADNKAYQAGKAMEKQAKQDINEAMKFKATSTTTGDGKGKGEGKGEGKGVGFKATSTTLVQERKDCPADEVEDVKACRVDDGKNHPTSPANCAAVKGFRTDAKHNNAKKICVFDEDSAYLGSGYCKWARCGKKEKKVSKYEQALQAKKDSAAACDECKAKYAKKKVNSCKDECGSSWGAQAFKATSTTLRALGLDKSNGLYQVFLKKPEQGFAIQVCEDGNDEKCAKKLDQCGMAGRPPLAACCTPFAIGVGNLDAAKVEVAKAACEHAKALSKKAEKANTSAGKMIDQEAKADRSSHVGKVVGQDTRFLRVQAKGGYFCGGHGGCPRGVGVRVECSVAGLKCGPKVTCCNS